MKYFDVKYFKVRQLAKYPLTTEDQSLNKESHIIYKIKEKEVRVGYVEYSHKIVNYVYTYNESSYIIKESDGNEVKFYENEKTTENSHLLSILNIKNAHFSDIFCFSDSTSNFLIKFRIILLQHDKHIYNYMYLIFTVNMKEKTESIKLDYSIKYPGYSFKSIFTQKIKKYPSTESLLRDIYICNTNNIDCIKNLIYKYSIVFDKTNKDFISEIDFNSGDLKLHQYVVNIPHNKYDINMLITNQNGNYPLTSEYQESISNPCTSIKCLSNGDCNSDISNKNIKCTCRRGLFGISCEHEYYCGWCYSDQCNKNIKCFECPLGLKGTNCEVVTCENINMCNDHGDCNVDDGIRKCKCHQGWAGDYCNLAVCKNTLACLNKGICIHYNGKDQCYCTEDYIGDLCETRARLTIYQLLLIIFIPILIIASIVIITMVWYFKCCAKKNLEDFSEDNLIDKSIAKKNTDKKHKNYILQDFIYKSTE